MPLMDLWRSNPAAIAHMSIEQIVSSAGDGKLRDGSECSTELRAYMSQVAIGKLAEYADHCLTQSFNKSGIVLQDVVNEIGRRLEYVVENGRYQGSRGVVGYDGVWQAPDGHWLVVEVKTTDTYRISLDTVAAYRKSLIAADSISSASSILIVVGREDTGELEAQVRGSRHAWDIRLISTDALIKLANLRADADDPETAEQIRSLLSPFEYTKLDGIIDVMFTTARDVERASEDLAETVNQRDDAASTPGKEKHVIDAQAIASTREAIIDAMAEREGTPLVKRSRATYWSSDHTVRIICTVSKPYDAIERYWYAYHPKWDDFLKGGERSHVVFGCVGLPMAFAIPVGVLRTHLDHFNTTVRSDGSMYWHVKILEREQKQYTLHLPKIGDQLSLDAYRLELKMEIDGFKDD